MTIAFTMQATGGGIERGEGRLPLERTRWAGCSRNCGGSRRFSRSLTDVTSAPPPIPPRPAGPRQPEIMALI